MNRASNGSDMKWSRPPESVTVTFDEAEPATTETAPCKALLTPQVFEIDLEEPLGVRALYDGVQAVPRPVWRRAEVVGVQVLPEGVAADELTASPEVDQGPDSSGPSRPRCPRVLAGTSGSTRGPQGRSRHQQRHRAR